MIQVAGILTGILRCAICLCLLWLSGCGSHRSGADDKVQSADFVPLLDQVGSEQTTFRSESMLPSGAELNAVVDLSCLAGGRGGSLSGSVDVPLSLLASVRDPRRAVEKPLSDQLYSATFRLHSGVTMHGLRGLADADPCLVRLTPNTVYSVSGKQLAWPVPTDDPFTGQQLHLRFLGTAKTYSRFLQVSSRTRPPIIAVIDTGIDLTHPDLLANAWTNAAEIPNNGIDDDGNGFVDDINGYNFASRDHHSGPQSEDPYFRHATHVAGLAAARAANGVGVLGIDGLAQLMSLNVFGTSYTARVSSLENAIRYAVNNGATVLNLSVGGREYSSSMLLGLRYAIRRGAVIVAAAGNNGVAMSGNPASPRFVSPAAFGSRLAGMLTVTSVDLRSGALSAFSNFSFLSVELAAPGAFRSGDYQDGLLSTFPHGTYGWLGGTSMATPLVSGAAALVQSWLAAGGRRAQPWLVEQILNEGARPVSSLLGLTTNAKVLDLDMLLAYLERLYPLND